MDQSDLLMNFDFLECPICFKKMTSIAFLATEPDEAGNYCMHSFCFDCISGVVDFNKKNGLPQTCPICRRSITMMGHNVLADNLSSTLSKLHAESKQYGALLDDKNKEIQGLQNQQNHCNENHAQLENSVKLLGSNLEEECKKNEELLQRLAQDREKHEELQAQKSKLDEERSRLAKKIVSIREEAEELRATLNEKEEAIKNLTTQFEGERQKWSQNYQRTLNERNSWLEERKQLEESRTLISEQKNQQQHEVSKWRQLYEQLQQEKERRENEIQQHYKFEVAKIKNDQQRLSEGLKNRDEELQRANFRLEEKKAEANDMISKQNEKSRKLELENTRLRDQQRILENRIGELEEKLKQVLPRVNVAERDAKMFADMYESTKATLKEKEMQLHQMRRNSRATRTDEAGGIMDMVKNGIAQSTNASLLTSFSKTWWGTTGPTAAPQPPTTLAVNNNPTIVDKMPLTNFAEYVVIEKRGSSKTSAVWKAREMISKNIVALKKKLIPGSVINQQNYYYSLLSGSTNLSSMRLEDQIVLFREAMLLFKFSHPNIIKVTSVIQQPKELYLVMTFVEYDLEFWNTQNRLGNEEQIKDVFYQVLMAIYYVHTAECVHRNISPQAILLNDHGKVKLAGFGAAFSLFSQPIMGSPSAAISNMSSSLSYLRYCAPELVYNQQIFMSEWNYWKEADVWSAGCVLAEMLLKRPLFHVSNLGENARDDSAILRSIYRVVDCRVTTPGFQDKHPILRGVEGFFRSPEARNFEQTSLQHLLPNASPQSLDLLRKMLQIEYHKRPDVLTLMHHPWFASLPAFSTTKLSCHLSNEVTDDDIPEFVNAIFS